MSSQQGISKPAVASEIDDTLYISYVSTSLSTSSLHPLGYFDSLGLVSNYVPTESNNLSKPL